MRRCWGTGWGCCLALEYRHRLAHMPRVRQVWHMGTHANPCDPPRRPHSLQGCVALLHAGSGDMADLMSPGDAFGELALLPDLAARRRMHTVCVCVGGGERV